MRHAKNTCKLGRNSSHRRCLFANLLKSLVVKGQIETTEIKAKFLKRLADKLVTLAKKDTLAARRRVAALLMIQHNKLTPKETKQAKAGDKTVYNDDRLVIPTLFGPIKEQCASRQGGYTRLVKTKKRIGDAAQMCIISFTK